MQHKIQFDRTRVLFYNHLNVIRITVVKLKIVDMLCPKPEAIVHKPSKIPSSIAIESII